MHAQPSQSKSDRLRGRNLRQSNFCSFSAVERTRSHPGKQTASDVGADQQETSCRPRRDRKRWRLRWALEHPKYRVAVVQAAPAWLDLDASIKKTIALIEEAAAKGAKLIAFPEVFIPGYPWHIWLDSPAWAIGRGFVQRYFDNSLSYDSPQAEKLREAVRKAKLTAVIGLSERDGGSLYHRAMADRPRWRDHRQAPQAAADPCRAHRLWRGRRQRSCRARPAGYRPARRAVLLGASAAAVEIRHVCPERAGPCRGMAELLALRSLCAGAGLGGQQRRLARLCGRGLLLRAGAVRDRLASHDR